MYSKIKYETAVARCAGTCRGLEKPEDLVSSSYYAALTNYFPPEVLVFVFFFVNEEV